MDKRILYIIFLAMSFQAKAINEIPEQKFNELPEQKAADDEARKVERKIIIEQELLDISKEIALVGFNSKIYKKIRSKELTTQKLILQQLSNVFNKEFFALVSLSKSDINFKNSLNNFSDSNKEQIYKNFILAFEKTTDDIKNKLDNKNNCNYNNKLYFVQYLEDMYLFLLNIKKNQGYEEFRKILKKYLHSIDIRLQIKLDEIDRIKKDNPLNPYLSLNAIKNKLLCINRIDNVFQKLVHDELLDNKSKNLIDQYISTILVPFKLHYSQEGIKYVKSIYSEEKDLSSKVELCNKILDFYKDNQELAKTEQAEWDENLKTEKAKKENERCKELLKGVQDLRKKK